MPAQGAFAPILGQVPALAPGLYIVATPIGNLADITIRALQILAAVDLIACEDTRESAKLLRHYGISTATLAYHDHNEVKMTATLLRRLRDGARIALISDAGTPLISDPGYRLLQAALAEQISVLPIPGACAAITALSAAGLPSDRFLFAGFPPPKQAARQRFFQDIAGLSATLIFYESSNRLAASLADMAAIFGPRPVVLAREMTKRFETFARSDLARLAKDISQQPKLKGEIVLLVDRPADRGLDDSALIEALQSALSEKTLKSAVAMVAADTGAPRRRVYRLALALRNNDPA